MAVRSTSRRATSPPVQSNSIVQAKRASTSDVVPATAARSLSNLKVNAGGRLLEVSREASLSVILLRRELVAQLNVASSSSVQVSDLAGKHINSDEDLKLAIQEGKHPLQAKLTVSALHEIEQKKREAEGKKEELLNYQWQVLCEQSHNISSEVGTLASQLAGIKEECMMSVRKFQENEEMRRVELYAQLSREMANREDLEKSLNAKVEALAQHLTEEKMARDVAVNQSVLRIEQVESVFNADRSLRAREQEAVERANAALRHDFELDAQKRAEDWSQNLEMLKRMEARMAEHNIVVMDHQKRLTSIEAAVDKLRSSLGVVETNVAMHHRAAHDGLQRSGEELKRAMLSGNLSAGAKNEQLVKTFEINLQSLEVRLQGLREEAVEDRAALESRAQTAEQRCMNLEKELADYQNSQAIKEQLMLDRLQGAVTILDSLEMAQKANDVVVQTTSTQVEDLTDQLRSVQGAVHERIRSDQARNQFDTLHAMLSNYQVKAAHLEQELSNRLAQEAAHRDSLRLQVHESVRKAFDKLTLKFSDTANNSVSNSNLRRSISVTSVKSMTSDVATEDGVTPRRLLSGKDVEIGGQAEDDVIPTTVLTSDALPRRTSGPPPSSILRTAVGSAGVTNMPSAEACGAGDSVSGAARVITVRPASASSIRRGTKGVEPVAGPTLIRRMG